MAEGQWTNIIDKYSDPNRFEPGDISGDDVYGGPKYGWVSREKYNELLQAGSVSKGQQTVELVREAALGTAGKWWNEATGAWEENVGTHIPDIEPNEQVKKGIKTGVDVAGHLYNWTLGPTVDRTMMLLDIPVQGAHWVSKKLDSTGRGIGTGPLGITEALLTFGAGSIKSGGKGLLKHGDELLEQGAKVLRDPQLAYEAIPVSPNVFNTKPLTTTNSMGIEGLSNVYQAKATVAASKNVISTLSPEDQIIRETFPRKGSKHDQSLIEALSGNPTGPAAELRDIVLQQNKKLQHAPTITLNNGRIVKVTRLVKGEAQDLANRISDLKKQLNISAPSKYDQLTGYYVEGTSLFRLNSKGKLVKIQDNVDRNILEKLWPIDESQKTARQLQTAAREKHHFRILEPSKIFAQVRDKSGNWVKRKQQQIDNVTARLQKDGVFIGNQDLNEVFQTKAAHIGAGGNRYGSHAQLRTLTDIQGRTLADADFLKVINKQDGTTVWIKQVKNKKGVITDFVTETGEKFKPSHIGETLEYKVGGRTYDPKAMHGFSKEGIEYISKIKGDDELYNAMKLYYEINDEAYKGVVGLASKLVDAKVQVDDLTKTLVKEFSPETQNWINHLLTLPEYKRDTRLLQALIRNSKDLLTLPKYKDNLKLQSLAKRIQTGLDSQTALKQKLNL